MDYNKNDQCDIMLFSLPLHAKTPGYLWENLTVQQIIHTSGGSNYDPTPTPSSGLYLHGGLLIISEALAITN